MTYTLDADFDEGTLINVNHDTPNIDQLQLNSVGEPFGFIWVAASGLGTIVKIDTITGEVLGEYLSAPDGRGRDPSRTTVDANGNVWAGNRVEFGLEEGSGLYKGSVVHIGLLENGQCVDRNGNGVIDTSTGLGDIRPWLNPGGVDDSGGVTSADDECIIHYVRTAGTAVRTVAVDGNNDVWVGGFGNNIHEKIDGLTGTPVPGTQFDFGFAGYGGLVDGNGILWSASGIRLLLRYDPATGMESYIDLTIGTDQHTSYGLGIDTNGFIWHSNFDFNTILKIHPSGAPILGPFPTGGSSGDRGVAVTPADNHVWVANSGDTGGLNVSRLDNDGNLLAVIPIVFTPTGVVGLTPTGLAVDAAGKVWVTNRDSDNVMRIDPATNKVDLAVSLRTGSAPYNYSDMTGSTLTATPDTGTWTVIYDGGCYGNVWDEVSVTWNSYEPGDSSIIVEVASGNDGVTFGPAEEVVEKGDSLTVTPGQFLKVGVTFERSTDTNIDGDDIYDSPILYDLTIECNKSNQPPEAVCQDIEVALGASGDATISAEDVDGGSSDPIGLSVDTSDFTCDDLGENTVTLTVTDVNGAEDSCDATVTVVDEIPPDVVLCNAPETIVPPDAPISFTATATDTCGVSSVEIVDYDCYKYTKKGKRIDKTESCVVEFSGDTITILDSGGVGDHITWTVLATDDSGNTNEVNCAVEVVNPGKSEE